MLQKSVVKCQSTFERIREAWSDIFGFQYRPAPMNEANINNYDSQEKMNNKKKNTNKKMARENNKTRKLGKRK